MCYGQTGSGKTYSMLGLTNNYKQNVTTTEASAFINCKFINYPTT